MMRYKVKISGKALADMEEVYNYIANTLCEPNIAMQQYDRIAKGIESLNTFPERCKLLNIRKDLEMRQLLVDNYSVVYMIEDGRYGCCVTSVV